MTQDTEHTYGFYLITLNRIRRDMDTNRTALHIACQTQDTNTALLKLMDKYTSNAKTANNVNKIITHSQIVFQRLDSEYRLLQSDYDTLNAHMHNNEDIASRAYDMAYSEPSTTVPHPQNKVVPILTSLAKFFGQRTK